MIAFFLQQSPANPIIGFLPIILIVAIFYFLLFLPMQRQRKQTKQLLEGLKNGDDVITSGGLIGTIFAINAEEELVTLRLRPDNVKVVIARSAVSGLAGQKSGS